MKVAVEVTVLLSGGDAVGEQDIERLLRSPETLHTLGEHKPAETPQQQLQVRYLNARTLWELPLLHSGVVLVS
jgi:hypothetical protein